VNFTAGARLNNFEIISMMSTAPFFKDFVRGLAYDCKDILDRKIESEEEETNELINSFKKRWLTIEDDVRDSILFKAGNDARLPSLSGQALNRLRQRHKMRMEKKKSGES
jgi:hypothetical protein